MKKFSNTTKPLGQIGETTKWGKIERLQSKNLKKEMELQFHIEISAEKNEELQQRISNGEILTLEELQNNYSPNQTDIDKVTNWLTLNNFTNIRQSADKCSLWVTSTVENIQNKMNVNMVEVVDGSNVSVSSIDEPTLPLSAFSKVNAITGLQTHIKLNKHSKEIKPINRTKTNLSASTQIAFSAPYLTSEILGAYNGLGLTFSGQNQTIGILIDTIPNNTDLTKFWTNNRVNTNLNRVTYINVRNRRLPKASGEETLDVEWTSGIAQNANIRVYASGDLYFSSLDLAIDRIISDCASFPTMKQISVSLGLGEKQMTPSEMVIQNTKWSRLAALGVNVFVSSGDGGSMPDGILQVEFPACNPNVVAVGGTSIRLTATGSVFSETGWSGSGGGVSTVYSKPNWQSTLSGSGRLVPDISAPADPNTGAYVFLNNRVYQIGGTSWSAPVWAGICAILNESRVKSGKSTLPFLPTRIYQFLSTNRFKDITVGNNGTYSCSVGYDRVTGIGVPDIRNLITGLLAI